MTTDTATARTVDGDARDQHAGGAPRSAPKPTPLLGDLDTIARGLVQTYPLLTLTGAMLGGYVVARLARRTR